MSSLFASKFKLADLFCNKPQPAQWQRLPMRVTLKPAGGEPATYDIVGTTSILEDGESLDEN
jgi:hypothetical protein